MKRRAFIPVMMLVLLLPGALFGQAAKILSAEEFFTNVSDAYGKVKDYQASFTMTRGKDVWTGTISYKSPTYLRLDFSNPPKQVLNFDGEKLTWYYPANDVILEQNYKKKSSAQIESMVSSQGLTMWHRNYSIAYLSGSSEVPLDDGSREMVVKLKLVSRASTSYSQMIVSVAHPSPDEYRIRRVEGTLTNGEKVVMDYTAIHVNQNIPDSRFQYDGPADAAVISDWLFDPTEE